MGRPDSQTANDLFAAWASLQLQLDAHRPRPGWTGESDRRVATRETPVCLLTGFLGSGKSTLLASLLADAESGLRVTAIVNDVGALPFDPTLVAWADDVRVEFTNGCGCCQSSDSLADTLRDVTDQATGRPWDLIVIEASGAADPLALAQIVEADPAVTLDRIITVVPATLAVRDLPSAARSIIDRQIDSAHCIVVSHCDLVEPADVDTAVAELQQVAPGRTITPSTLGEPAIHVFHPNSPRGARSLSDIDGNVHRDLFVETVSSCRPVTENDLRRVLEASRPGLVRAKGRLIVDGRVSHVQMTPQSIEIAPDAGAASAQSTRLTLVAVDGSAVRPVLNMVAADRA